MKNSRLKLLALVGAILFSAACFPKPQREDPAVLLQTLQTSKDITERINIVVKLGNMRYRPALPDIAKCLHNSSPQMRLQAAMSLGQLGEKAAAPELASALGTEQDAMVKSWIIWSLGETATSAEKTVLNGTLVAERAKGPLGSKKLVADMEKALARINERLPKKL